MTRYRNRTERRAAAARIHALASEYGHDPKALSRAHPELGSRNQMAAILSQPPPGHRGPPPKLGWRLHTWRRHCRALETHRLHEQYPQDGARRLAQRHGAEITSETVRRQLATPRAEWARRETEERPPWVAAPIRFDENVLPERQRTRRKSKSAERTRARTQAKGRPKPERGAEPVPAKRTDAEAETKPPEPAKPPKRMGPRQYAEFIAARGRARARAADEVYIPPPQVWLERLGETEEL